jgi:hypothetical protein
MAGRRETENGLVVYGEVIDTQGSQVWVQESSALEGPQCWIFSCHPEFTGLSPQLDREQAIEIRDALDAFIREAASSGN